MKTLFLEKKNVKRNEIKAFSAEIYVYIIVTNSFLLLKQSSGNKWIQKKLFTLIYIEVICKLKSCESY